MEIWEFFKWKFVDATWNQEQLVDVNKSEAEVVIKGECGPNL